MIHFCIITQSINNFLAAVNDVVPYVSVDEPFRVMA